MRRWVILLSCLLVLVLLAVPLGGAWFLLYTPAGLQTLLRFTPRHLPGTELHIEGASGILARTVHLDVLELRNARFDARLRDVQVRPSLRLALLQTLELRSLRVAEADIQVFHRPPSNAPLNFLPYSLSLQVDALGLARLHVVQPSGHTFDASNLSTRGIVRARTIRYSDAQMNTGGLVWRSAQGILRGGAPSLGVEASLDLDYHVAGSVPWSIQLNGNGDLSSLNLTARFKAPFDATYSGLGLNLDTRWHLKGDLAVRNIDLYTWGAARSLGSAHGTVHVEGDLDDFTARGPVLMDTLQAGTLNMNVHASWAGRTLTLKEAQATHPQLGWHAFTHGTVTVQDGGPRLDLAGTWTDLRIPLGARDGLRSHAGTFSLAGLWPYDARASGDLQIPDLPLLACDVTGLLFRDHAQFTRAVAHGPDGSSTAFSGTLGWPPRLDWTAAGTVADFDPSVFAATVPMGHMAFGFTAHGAGFRTNSDFSVQLRDLAGTVRGLPARGAGNLARLASTWRFDAVRLQLGGATVALDGTVGGLDKSSDVKFDLHAPDLRLLRTGWRGHLNAAGQVHGTLRDPVIDATATGGAIQYGGVSLAGLEARVDIDSHRSAASHVQLHAQGLALGTRHVDDALLRLDGPTGHHDLALKLQAGEFHLDANGSGSLSEGAWSGQLDQVRARNGGVVNLQLVNPVNLLLSSTAVRVNELCLSGQPARLCATGDWSPAHWSLGAQASDLPMQTLTAGQSGTADYQGNIGLQLALAGNAGQPFTGQISAHLADARMLRRLSSGRIETTTLGSGTITVNADPQAIAAQLDLDAGAVGSLKGHLSAQRSATDWRELPLSGQVDFKTAELGFIPLYVPQVDRAAGRLSASLDLGGTPGAPLLDGSLHLEGGELDLYRVNLALRAASLDASLTGNSLKFDGAAQLGNGHAAARGTLAWRDGAPHGSFILSGENLRVANVPEAQVDASPELNFDVDGPRIAVTGSVKIPHAHLAPADLTNAVLSSADEVIVSNNAPSADPGARFTVITDVTLSLGDDVTIETRGLKARLGGSIATHAGTDETVTRASGEVSVAQGTYTAYGRKLDIDRGRLIFSGGPVGDPGVDVRAVKRFDDPTAGATLAGINVRGTLRSPQLSFFSEPPLPQQQIVSLILAGGGLVGGQTNNVSGSTAASRGATNNELLGQGAAILGQQLGSKIGITDVGVESNIYNETSLVLGRYLSPRLYVSYGVGLTQTLNTVKLRYTLGDHWMIRTEFGQLGGADLVYTLDK